MARTHQAYPPDFRRQMVELVKSQPGVQLYTSEFLEPTTGAAAPSAAGAPSAWRPSPSPTAFTSSTSRPSCCAPAIPTGTAPCTASGWRREWTDEAVSA